MRALCGAIITAAALIGMGLTAQGIGTRYTMERAYYSEQEGRPQTDAEPGEGKGDPKKTPAPIGKPARVLFGDMDRPLAFILVFLTCMAIIGLAIAFLGLAYHQMRRDRDYQLEKERYSAHQRASV